jgi:uncharacterized protein YndB with AHSA1/START domain
MKVEHAVVIERPREEVWAVFDDPELMVEWQGNLLEYEQLEGESDEIGSISRQTIKNVGVKSDLTVTLLERDEPELSSSHYEGAQVPFTVINTFSDLGDGTTEWHAELEVRLGLVQKALAPILKPLMSDLVSRNGRDFKAFVESR